MAAAWIMGVRYASGLAGIAACLAIGALFGAGITALSVGLAFSLRTLILTGWQAGPLLGTVAALLAFDIICLTAATLALRRGLRA